jgi:hypothetical protein
MNVKAERKIPSHSQRNRSPRSPLNRPMPSRAPTQRSGSARKGVAGQERDRLTPSEIWSHLRPNTGDSLYFPC